MKNIFVFTVIFVFTLTGCDNGNETQTDDSEKTTLRIKNESSKTLTDVLWNNIVFDNTITGSNSDIIGNWAGQKEGGYPNNCSLNINTDNTWSVVFDNSNINNGTGRHLVNGLWTRSVNALTLNTSDSTSPYNATVSGRFLQLTTPDYFSADYWWNGSYMLYKNNAQVNQIKSGTSIIKVVNPGSGYIYFKIGVKAYRTNSVVIIQNNDNGEFIFTDYTVVVDMSNDTVIIINNL